ncbi:hypothetical protein TNCV_4983991 [Trichonephila clavipes]|nr:hypothetical protein TNCV_4983991 [Trichonephila clavipes]
MSTTQCHLLVPDRGLWAAEAAQLPHESVKSILCHPTCICISLVDLHINTLPVLLLREEFFEVCSQRSFHTISLLSLPSLGSGMTEASVFSFELHSVSGRRGLPAGVKGCLGDVQDKTV